MIKNAKGNGYSDWAEALRLAALSLIDANPESTGTARYYAHPANWAAHIAVAR